MRRDPCRELVIAIQTIYIWDLCTCCQALAHLDFLHAVNAISLGSHRAARKRDLFALLSAEASTLAGTTPNNLQKKSMYLKCVSRVSVLFSPRNHGSLKYASGFDISGNTDINIYSLRQQSVLT